MNLFTKQKWAQRHKKQTWLPKGESESEVTQLYPTLCDPVDYSLPGSSVHGGPPGKNTGVDCQALLQGIFPTQGQNPGLPHYRQILYHLSHKGSPDITGSYSS